MPQKVKGDYILLNGVRYVICAPTYINVSVGVSIPDMGKNNTLRNRHLYSEKENIKQE